MKKKILIILWLIVVVLSSIALGVLAEKDYKISKYYDTEVLKKNYEIEISDSLEQELKDLFNTSYPYEYSACLNGNWNTNFETDDASGNYTHKITLTSIESFKVSELKTKVSHQCDTFAKIHNHPEGVCRMSAMDIQYFRTHHKNYGMMVNIVQCEENKMIIYTYKNYLRGIIYEI